jgi:cysteine desulfurase
MKSSSSPGNMTPIYLDNNATTRIHPEVAAAMDECQRAGLGNPASPHYAGRQARRILEAARHGIASILGARVSGMAADTVVFTSGGTEANNLALRGIGRNRPGRTIISAIEHPSVRGAAEYYAADGSELAYVPVDENGVIQIPRLADLLTQPARLVSIMLGNNETGVLQPVGEAAELCRQRGVLIHTDAVQCAGKVEVDFQNLGVDALTISAHKFHGPAGMGVLLVKHGVTLDPLTFGGFQQAGIRPGTESVPLAVGMYHALQLWQQSRHERTTQLSHLRETFEQALKSNCPDIVIHGNAVSRLPHTTNIAFLGLDRQALMMAFDMANIACSTGSACASGSSDVSPVLLAMGLPAEIAGASIRFSLSLFTETAEVLEGAQRISEIVKDLRQGIKSLVMPAAPPKSWVAPV